MRGHVGVRRAGLLIVAALAMIGAPAGASTATAADPPAPAQRIARISGVPTLLGPANGAASTWVPILAWTAVPHAVRYDLQFTTGDFPPYDYMAYQTTQTRFSPPGELPAGTYKWRVRAMGVQNHGAPWSAVRTFVKQARLTETPGFVSPADGATMAYPDGLVALRWTPVRWAGGYQVNLEPSPVFEEPNNIVATAVHPGANPVSGVPLGTPTYWRIRAVTGSNGLPGPWSETRTYTITWDDAPTLVQPSNAATVSAFRFEWQPLAGAIRYDIQVADYVDAGFADAASTDTTATSIDWTGPYPSDDVRWRVRARGADGLAGPWSETRRATRAPAGSDPEPAGIVSIPAVPIVGPANGATGVVPSTTPLDWNAVAGALGYEIEYGTGPDPFVEPQVSYLSAPVAPSVPWQDLEAGTTYTWRIRGIGHGGATGPWTTRTFTTASATAPAPSGPADGATVPGSTLAFRWTPTHTAAAQALFLSETADFAAFRYRQIYADGALAWGGIPVGTWYWRVHAGDSGLSRVSATRTITITDDTPPGGEIYLLEGSTTSDTLYAELWAEDPETDVTQLRWSVDGGATWSAPESNKYNLSVSIVTPEAGGTEPGLRRLSLMWRNGAGLWSAPLHTTVWYKMPDPGTDSDPDIVTEARMGLARGPIANTTAPVVLTWKHTQIGISQAQRFDVEYRPFGGVFALVAQPTTATLTRQLKLGVGSQHRVRPIDWAGNIGPWSNIASGTPSSIQSNSSASIYRGTWTTDTGSAWWGGSARWSSTKGSSVTTAFTGRDIGWVSRLGPTRGKASIYIDDVFVVTVDLYAPTDSTARVVWTRSWPVSGRHTISVRIQATPGRPRVDHDGFVKLS